jgi:phytoene/squalene synthetase
MLYLFGYRSPALMRYADDLSAGLALANFWQDVGRDLDRDRIYLPAEDLRHFGVSEADLHARRPTQAFRDLMRFEVARARATLDRGRPLIEAVGPDVGVDLAAFWLGGRAMLDKIEASGFDVLTRRPRATTFDLFRVGVRAVWWRTRVRIAGRGALTAAEGAEG